MPRMCSVYGCRGNYKGEPYSPVVKCPDDPDIRKQWIDAMPNKRGSLEKLKEIWICRRHFDCQDIKVQGGSRPSCHPTILMAFRNLV